MSFLLQAKVPEHIPRYEMLISPR